MRSAHQVDHAPPVVIQARLFVFDPRGRFVLRRQQGARTRRVTDGSFRRSRNFGWGRDGGISRAASARLMVEKFVKLRAYRNAISRYFSCGGQKDARKPWPHRQLQRPRQTHRQARQTMRVVSSIVPGDRMPALLPATPRPIREKFRLRRGRAIPVDGFAKTVKK